ncbi:MAG: choice-of-anchor A family protein, partial [Anaerolineales bacterium]|nr:choice-of-anchor A family protein [Anaerolineales bacterium]
LDLAPYQNLLDAAVSRSQCWVGLTQSANAQFTDGGGGNYTFNSTNGASGLYVFTLNQDLDPGFGSSLTFTNFPDDATILINVLGATRSLNITNITVNGTAMGTGSFTAEPLAEQILWNFPTATTVTLNGSSQFWGSVVAPQADVTLGTSTNGRLLIGGDLNQGTVSGAGLELHNYPFNGSLPTCDRGDLPDTGAGTGAGNYATLISDNGPTHIVTSTTPRLGACVDGESDGQQGTTASGDNSNGSDAIDTTALDPTHVNVQGTCGASGDEDGVVVAAGSGAGGVWQDGANGGSIDVVGTTGACLNGWIDWNGNGSFLDANEQVASNVALTGASQNIQFTVPAGTFTGIGPNINLHARYRVTQNCGTNDYINPSTGAAVAPSPDGPANNGEVEDYLWSFTPTAVELQQVAGTTSNHPSTAVLFTLTSLLLITALFVLRRASQRF